MNIQWTSVFYFFMLCRVSLSIFKARPVKTLFSRSRLMMISSESRSAVVNHSFGATSIVVVPMFDDNYGYIFVDEFSRSCAVIDPADTEPMIKALNDLESERGVVLKQVWCTHKHADHAGGNLIMAEKFPEVEIVGSSYEETSGLQRTLVDNEEFKLGETDILVKHVSCHTKGHICFVATNAKSQKTHLFAGDCIFAGGCGRFFEGTGKEMLKNMDFFATLPDDTVVCPAHEYTEANYKFLAALDPETCGAEYERVKGLRAAGTYTVPTTIGAEKELNAFMRCNDPTMQELVFAMSRQGAVRENPEVCMDTLRHLKNKFK